MNEAVAAFSLNTLINLYCFKTAHENDSCLFRFDYSQSPKNNNINFNINYHLKPIPI